jgi:alpha-mannosidase
MDYLLGDGESSVTIEGRIDFREHWRMLKLSFFANLEARESTAEVPYGTTARAIDGREWPMSQWVDISGREQGLAIATDAKHGYSARFNEVVGTELRITLLRTPPHAYDQNTPLDLDSPNHHWTDQGVSTFKLALIPHAGDWRRARVLEIARLLNRPPTCLADTFHPGALPARASFARCRGRGVSIAAIKPAEDGEGWIVRAAEWFGKKAKAEFSLPMLDRSWTAAFGPWQIKTFLVPQRRGSKVREVNLIEDRI